MSNILMCGNEPLGLLQGNASDISFDNSGGGILSDNVQDAIEEINDKKFNKSGGKISGTTELVNNNTSTTFNDSRLYLGNNIPDGTTGASRGVLTIYDKNRYQVTLLAGNGKLTADRYIDLPDKGGTFAVTADITNALTWTTLGYCVHGAAEGLDIPTNYTEFYIQPVIYQANYNSFLVTRNNLNNFYISIYESSTNYLYGRFEFSNNKLTFSMSQTAGWGGATTPKFYIKAR